MIQPGTDTPAADRIALKLRATRPPAQERWTKSVPRQGHNTPVPLRRSPPGSFKRLLGGGFINRRHASSAPQPQPAGGDDKRGEWQRKQNKCGEKHRLPSGRRLRISELANNGIGDDLAPGDERIAK